MSARILLTGSTKFLGKHVFKELISRGLAFDCLVRSHSKVVEILDHNIGLVEGDLNEPDHLTEVIQGYDTVINIPNLAFIHSVKDLVDAYERAGVKRAVFVSSTGIFTKLNAKTKPLRIAAEDAIRDSNLTYTILRPTLIYGTPEDNNVARLLHFCRRAPVIPIFGSGQALQQPVHVEDLAWAIVEVLNNSHTYYKAYNLGGGEVLTYNDLVRSACRALGRRSVLINLPTAPAAFVVKLANQRGIHLPVSEEQVLRLKEDKAYDISEAKADFNFNPRTFSEGVTQEASLL